MMESCSNVERTRSAELRTAGSIFLFRSLKQLYPIYAFPFRKEILLASCISHYPLKSLSNSKLTIKILQLYKMVSAQTSDIPYAVIHVLIEYKMERGEQTWVNKKFEQIDFQNNEQ